MLKLHKHEGCIRQLRFGTPKIYFKTCVLNRKPCWWKFPANTIRIGRSHNYDLTECWLVCGPKCCLCRWCGPSFCFPGIPPKPMELNRPGQDIWIGTTQQDKQQSTSHQPPATSKQQPVASKQQPAKRQTTSNQQQATSNQQSATSSQATSTKQPAANSQQPATSNQPTSHQQPAPSNQQPAPATSNKHAATSSRQTATSNQQPATSNKQPSKQH